MSSLETGQVIKNEHNQPSRQLVPVRALCVILTVMAKWLEHPKNESELFIQKAMAQFIEIWGGEILLLLAMVSFLSHETFFCNFFKGIVQQEHRIIRGSKCYLYTQT